MGKTVIFMAGPNQLNSMTRVMAQGTFDIIHPGHLHYLAESRKLGDELVVIIARDERVADRKKLLMNQENRRQLVAALDLVDDARIGTPGDIYNILDEVDPDIVTIGYDQKYDLDEVRSNLSDRGYGDIEVNRISAYEPSNGEFVSSTAIKEALAERYSGRIFISVPDDEE